MTRRDPLAVMDALNYKPFMVIRDDIIEARAAVAKLVEAARAAAIELRDWNDEYCGGEQYAKVDRLNAALAPFVNVP